MASDKVDHRSWRVPDPLDDQGQHAKMARCVDAVSRLIVECAICGEPSEAEDISATSFARGLYEDGWRYAVSESFQLEGILCPKCFATPDELRGED